MRHLFVLVVLLVSLSGWLYAEQISVYCTPSEIFVNSLSTSSFDPVNPANQPILTHVNFQNNLGYNCLFNVRVMIQWNDKQLVDINFNSNESHPLLPGANIYTNRDLVNSNAGEYFGSPSSSITLSTIMDASPTLRDALQSGYFPDGDLVFSFIATPTRTLDGNPIPNAEPSSAGVFRIIIKNINSIFLSYPGSPIGQNPPEINIRPVTFLWSTVSSGNNDFWLVVKEFRPDDPPTPTSVLTTGKKVFTDKVTNNMFSGFLPFQDKHYYAWQISTRLYNETNPDEITNKQATADGNLASDWYVFKFASDTAAMEDAYSQLRAILNSLNNETIQDAFTQGFDVTGAILYEDQVYSGKDAVDLAKTLIGKDIEVELSDN